MEAVGSRLARTSSRYGVPTVFSGPVRKWKKKWVHVSSPARTLHNSHSRGHSHTNVHNKNNKGGSGLLLCRWTPIATPQGTTTDDTGNVSDEPPRRKFRYTPIAVLEEQKKVVIKKPGYEPTTESDQLTDRQVTVTHEMHGKLNMNESSEQETQDSNMSQLDLGLGFNGNNGESSPNSADQVNRRISSAWSMN